MAEKEVEVGNKMSVTIKIDAKGNPYGEYTARGDTAEELDSNIQAAEQKFKEQLLKQ